jgi:hypothetical protein
MVVIPDITEITIVPAEAVFIQAVVQKPVVINTMGIAMHIVQEELVIHHVHLDQT